MNRRSWLIAGAISLITGVLILIPRGIRNRNPGNIKKTSTVWQGQATAQKDPLYVVFINAVWGIRAIMRILHNYQANYGLNTIRGLISRWAPPDENVTAQYVEFVSKRMLISPDKTINVDEYLIPIARAIVSYENGYNPYGDAMFTDAQIKAMT